MHGQNERVTIAARANGWEIKVAGVREAVLFLVPDGEKWRPVRGPGAAKVRALSKLTAARCSYWRFTDPEGGRVFTQAVIGDFEVGPGASCEAVGTLL